MPLTNFKSDLTSYLKKLAGVHAVGELWWHYDPKSKPAGVQLFSGQLLSREAYADHWTLVFTKRTVVTEEEWQAMVTTQGFCQYYSSGDGSTTYRMPLVKGVHPKFVAALSEAGQYVQAGLPNITAETRGCVASNRSYGIVGTDVQTGAFFATGDNGTYGMGTLTNTTPKYNLGFDASLSNPIYGRSDTVQPEAITMVIGEWVVGSVAVVGEADEEALMEAINAKADADVGGKGVVRSVNGVNADAAGEVTLGTGSYIVEEWHDTFNWYRKWSNGFIEQGGKHTNNGATHKIALNTPFSGVHYVAVANRVRGTDESGQTTACYTEPYSAGMLYVFCDRYPDAIGTSSNAVNWFACGY